MAVFSLCPHTVALGDLLSKGSNPIHGGPTLRTYSPAKALTSQHCHIGVRIQPVNMGGHRLSVHCRVAVSGRGPEGLWGLRVIYLGLHAAYGGHCL